MFIVCDYFIASIAIRHYSVINSHLLLLLFSLLLILLILFNFEHLPIIIDIVLSLLLLYVLLFCNYYLRQLPSAVDNINHININVFAIDYQLMLRSIT